MSGEYLFSQSITQVDDGYFDSLQRPLRGHKKTPLEQRIDAANLSGAERRALRTISAELVVALAAVPDEKQPEQRASLLDTLSSDLPEYYDNVFAGLSRDSVGGKLSIVVGGQPLDSDELDAVYAAIPPSRQELTIRDAEAREGTDGLIDRTRLEELPDFIYDEAHPGEDIVELSGEEEYLEPTRPEDLHTGLARELGRIGLRLIDTGKLLVQRKIAS